MGKKPFRQVFYRIGREPVGSKENRFDTKGMDIFRLSGVSIGRNGIFTIGWLSRQQFIPAFLINIQKTDITFFG